MQARQNVQLASFLAGVAITASGTTAVHALSYPLGGKYHIAHGVSNAILLAPVMPSVSEKILSLLGQPRADRYEGNIEWSARLENAQVAAPEILFPRIGE